MMGLTPNQKRLLDFLRAWMAETGGIAPTCEEIRLQMGYASKGQASRFLSQLEERGAIVRQPNKARAIALVDGRYSYNALSSLSTARLREIERDLTMLLYRRQIAAALEVRAA